MKVFVITSELPPKKSSHVIRVQKLFQEVGFSTYSLDDFCKTLPMLLHLGLQLFTKLPFWHWIFPGHIFDFVDYSKVQEFAKSLPAESRIVSSSGNYLAHHVCHSIKVERPDIFWIADLGDPWAGGELFPENFPLRRAFAFLEERRAFSNVNRVFVTTRELQKQLKKRYRDVQYLPMGFLPPLEKEPSKSSDHYTLYGGSSYSLTRNLRPVMMASNSAGIPFRIVGDVSRKYHKFKKARCLHNVEIYSRMDFDVYRTVEKGASIQVVILNKGELQIPGKLYQCIASAPTLVVSQGVVTDEVRQICQMNSHVLIVPNDVKSISLGLMNLVLIKNFCLSDDFCEMFSWDSLSTRSKELVFA